MLRASVGKMGGGPPIASLKQGQAPPGKAYEAKYGQLARLRRSLRRQPDTLHVRTALLEDYYVLYTRPDQLCVLRFTIYVGLCCVTAAGAGVRSRLADF